MIKIKIILAVAILFVCACDMPKAGKKHKQVYTDVRIEFPYDLQSPSKIYELPKALHEISGVAAISDNLIACIADEKGTVYLYNLATENIDSKIKFAGKGDFEDITLVKDTLYVLDSRGTIWIIKNYQDHPQVSSVPLAIEPPFELEGLCQRGDTLFIAAKYYHNKKRDQEGVLPVWRLSPSLEVKDPIFSLPDIVKPAGIMAEPFHTSALLFDESMQEWLCISTHTKAFIRCNYSGNIISTGVLSAKEFSQPEGMCFTPAGNLLISNEGRDDKANLLLFNKKNK